MQIILGTRVQFCRQLLVSHTEQIPRHTTLKYIQRFIYSFMQRQACLNVLCSWSNYYKSKVIN